VILLAWALMDFEVETLKRELLRTRLIQVDRWLKIHHLNAQESAYVASKTKSLVEEELKFESKMATQPLIG